MTQLQEKLFSMEDSPYKDFMSALLPTVEKGRIIGVRMDQLRQLAKKTDTTFLEELPHQYLEEDHIHSIIISGIPTFSECVKEVERFLPYVDNWAVCDSLRPKCFAKNQEGLLPFIRRWLASGKAYTVRFGIEMLMLHYLGDHFNTEHLQLVAAVECDEYYVHMMQSWYFATALVMQWDAAIPYLQQRILPPWVHNKTIQKAIESNRITAMQKQDLRALKR